MSIQRHKDKDTRTPYTNTHTCPQGPFTIAPASLPPVRAREIARARAKEGESDSESERERERAQEREQVRLCAMTYARACLCSHP